MEIQRLIEYRTMQCKTGFSCLIQSLSLQPCNNYCISLFWDVTEALSFKRSAHWPKNKAFIPSTRTPWLGGSQRSFSSRGSGRERKRGVLSRGGSRRTANHVPRLRPIGAERPAVTIMSPLRETRGCQACHSAESNVKGERETQSDR